MTKLSDSELATYDKDDRVISSKEMRDELAKTPVSSTIISTGIDELDEAVGKIHGGELIAISGPPKCGKTKLCQTITVNMAPQGYNALWFSFEVPMRQFLTQMPEGTRFYTPKILRRNKIGWILNRMKEAMLKYDCKAIFIDHLHFLIDMAKGGRSVSIDIGEVVRSLKTFCNENDVAIFLLSHSTKASDKEGGTRELGQWDLRDSSFVPQEADTTWIIQRFKPKGQPEFGNDAQLKVCLCRRTGVMEKKIQLILRDGLLVSKYNPKPRQAAILRPDHDGGEYIVGEDEF